MTFNEYFLIGLAYLIGSIPFGLIVTKWSDLGDIRNQGSGNIGATNVARIAGKRLGALVLVLDLAKGAIAVLVAKLVMGFDPQTEFYCGIAAVIGHIFPLWLKFKGGKGVATALGTALVLIPYIALLVMVIWLFAFKMTRISAVAALVAVSLLPVIVFFFGDANTKFHMHYAISVSILVFLRHISNIKRLLDGKENKF
ncbi:MAG TPA: acyl-phosphate glycerol 3-phosphate acyltransferase [Alphaproteobacteria bacterium]|nr:acyl-phosphate glycerol 3-phosphate acyltransferase [Alphaproteobacteria bacterium]